MLNSSFSAGTDKPIVPYLNISDGNAPFLQGCRCGGCDAVYVGLRSTCAKCYARDKMQSVTLSTTGKLYNWTIVYRNFPGVKVPFISAIVDLDGGGTIKGNLTGIEPAPEKLFFDMPVKVVFRYAEDTDAEGNRYISYVFEPAG